MWSGTTGRHRPRRTALDKAAAKLFNSLIKVEYIHRHLFATEPRSA
ncbi:hypothetical protein [Streptomyces sp. HSG2]|nr:hypothetical protein [Streptomyces sp. HSG2]